MKCGLLLLYIVLNAKVNAQFTTNYFNSFDNANDTIGWHHYALQGTDDWVCGTPTKFPYSNTYSSPNAWVTRLDSNCSINSTSILETPFFNLSDTSQDYIISFMRIMYSVGSSCFLDYTINNGNTWQILYGTQCNNCQGSYGFSSNGSYFIKSSINLRQIQGNDSVKFRFRFITTNNATLKGWAIDNFQIIPRPLNVFANNKDSLTVSKYCSNFEVTTKISFTNEFNTSYIDNTNYYLSNDSIFDAQDVFLATRNSTIYQGETNFNQTINIPQNIAPGYYYIFYKHDCSNNLIENDENDNVGHLVLHVITSNAIPYSENFDGNTDTWRAYNECLNMPLHWSKGFSYVGTIYGSHSGRASYSNCNSINSSYNGNNTNVCTSFNLESQAFNFTSGNANTVFNFWYKNYLLNFSNYSESLLYSTNCGVSWDTIMIIPSLNNYEWKFENIRLNNLTQYNNVKFKFSIKFSAFQTNILNVDDIYIGNAKPDLTVEKDNIRFTKANTNIDTLHYYINNCGLSAAPSSTTSFFWSTDTILDATDIFLGSKQENLLSDTTGYYTSFAYNKVSTASSTYYLFYVLDSTNVVDEMREYNNVGYFKIMQSQTYTVPYSNNFDNNINDWFKESNTSNNNINWQTPPANVYDSLMCGLKTWYVTDSVNYPRSVANFIYSPIFNLSNSISPVLELDLKNATIAANMHLFASVSYSVDGGISWSTLADTVNNSYNNWRIYHDKFYNNDAYYSDANFYNYAQFFWNTQFFWKGEFSDRNTKHIISIENLKNFTSIQFKLSFTNLNKIDSTNIGAYLFDNFSIKEAFIDLSVTKKKSLMLSSISNKIKFRMEIRNQGNFNSKPSNVKFYVSIDSLLSTNDYFLGSKILDTIRPDMWLYTVNQFAAPPNLSLYKYLIYYLDANNTNIECNESNNVGFWKLALDSVKTYPFLSDFNDTIINGWFYYSTQINSTGATEISNYYNMRNFVFQGEDSVRRGFVTGKLFTDYRSSALYETPPKYYLQSPSFDFLVWIV